MAACSAESLRSKGRAKHVADDVLVHLQTLSIPPVSHEGTGLGAVLKQAQFPPLSTEGSQNLTRVDTNHVSESAPSNLLHGRFPHSRFSSQRRGKRRQQDMCKPFHSEFTQLRSMCPLRLYPPTRNPVPKILGGIFIDGEYVNRNI